MTKLALALVAAALSVAAVQDEMIENPEYKGWKGQKAGAWVKYNVDTDAGTMKMASTMTFKLKEMTAEKAVIDSVTVMEMGGKKVETPSTRPVPARVKKGTNSEGAKYEKTGEGDEEIEVKGEKLACHWAEMKVEAKTGPSTIKIWTNDKIVGGAAKLIMSFEKPQKMTMTMTAVDWKAGE